MSPGQDFSRSRGEAAGFAVKDSLHQLARVDVRVGQWPGESFGRRKLHRGAALALMTPECDESADASCSAAQLPYLGAACVLVGRDIGQSLGMFDEPFNQYSRLGIGEAASDGLVLKDAAQ
jgi:hypothetical protein